jgi:hypothetical protein
VQLTPVHRAVSPPSLPGRRNLNFSLLYREIERLVVTYIGKKLGGIVARDWGMQQMVGLNLKTSPRYCRIMFISSVVLIFITYVYVSLDKITHMIPGEKCGSGMLISGGAAQSWAHFFNSSIVLILADFPLCKIRFSLLLKLADR